MPANQHYFYRTIFNFGFILKVTYSTSLFFVKNLLLMCN